MKFSKLTAFSEGNIAKSFLAVILLSTTAGVAKAATCTVEKLIAGKRSLVGTVEVCPDMATVKYTITRQKYCLKEVRLAIGETLDDIPHRRHGSPLPGDFPNVANPGCTAEYTFNVAVNPGDYVAAYAVLQRPESEEYTRGAWAGSYRFPGRRKTTYFIVPTPDTPSIATCSQCTQLECITVEPQQTVSQCADGQDVCITTVVDLFPAREITRGCEVRATAEALVAANVTECSDVENHTQDDARCVFACDGVNSPGCNAPPELLPVDAILFQN